MNIFEKATKQKLRFTHKGQIGVEELWDLSLNELDKIYRTLAKESRESNQDSLLTETTSNSDLTLRIEIVKHIVTAKLADKQARADLAAKKAQIAQLDELISSKQNEALGAKTLEELTALRASLGA